MCIFHHRYNLAFLPLVYGRYIVLFRHLKESKSVTPQPPFFPFFPGTSQETYLTRKEEEKCSLFRMRGGKREGKTSFFASPLILVSAGFFPFSSFFLPPFLFWRVPLHWSCLGQDRAARKSLKGGGRGKEKESPFRESLFAVKLSRGERERGRRVGQRERYRDEDSPMGSV